VSRYLTNCMEMGSCRYSRSRLELVVCLSSCLVPRLWAKRGNVYGSECAIH
jgi:hypothetical protein